MSGTSMRMSTIPASAMVAAGDGFGTVVPAQPLAASSPASNASRSLLTATHPGEVEVFVIGAEIAIGIDLGHAHAAGVAAAGEIDPGVQVDAGIVPVQQVAAVEHGEPAVHLRRLQRAPFHAVAGRAQP